jgi:DNA-binding transcriptional LysR family regulator
MVSIRHDIFLTAAQQKSFSKAAQALYISQPAVSKHIKALEAYYKTNLFERKGLHIELTAAGKLLFDRLMQVKRIEEQTEFDISGIRDVMQSKGVLKLGASTTVALYILPKILSSFHQDYPQIQISSLNRNSELVLEALLKGDINLGIIEGRVKLTNVDYQPFLKDEVIAVCSWKSAIAKKKINQLKDILSMPLVIRERGSGTLAALKYTLEKNRIKISELDIQVRLGGTEALKNFLLESDLLGFLPKRSVLKELTQGELVQVHFEGLAIERSFYFIQRKGETSELNKSFIRIARRINNI